VKLVSIHLHDVRRFTNPVLISGIGPGLNVLAAPNEEGKSTVFDAVQALFTCPYRSKSADVRALRPHAGGAPRVTVEIDLPDGRFQIAKRWLSRPEAEVLRDGHVIAKSDEAEAWISRVAGFDDPAAPSGLLWVRQGLTTLDDGKATAEARRGLLVSVAGEVEAMTGGRRMDDARRRCTEELEQYVSGKGTRTRGPLKAAEDRIATLEPRIAELESRADELRADLDRRRVVLRELSELADPEAEAARQKRLSEAEATHGAATRHAQAIEQARMAEATATLKADAARQKLDALRKARADLADARTALEAAEAHARQIADSLSKAENALSGAQTRAEATATAAREAALILRRAEQAAAAQTVQERRTQLAETLGRAEDVRRQAETAAAQAGLGPDADALGQIEALAQQVAVHRAEQQAETPGVTLNYAPDAALEPTLDGAPLPDNQRVPLPRGGTLDLPGIGALTIHPGRTVQTDALPRAEDRLAQALARFDLPTVDAARAAARTRAEAESRRREALAQLQALAPDGLDVLQAALAALPEASAPVPDLPPVDAAQRAADQADLAASEAASALDAARRTAEAERQAATRAAAAVENARDRQDRATDALGDGADPEAAETALADALTACDADLAAARKSHADLLAQAPDLAAAEAALNRARDVARRAVEDRQRLASERQRLDDRIELRAGEAVEEDLADLRQQLQAAQDDAARCRFEVAVLRRLGEELDRARNAARDRFLAPVMSELGPLLRLLWPEAELRLDADTVLPSALVRKGTEEAFDTLSGGTREQIALLVRLAFARMLANDGRHAPVILDDALVYSDDDRIERMFDALHRQASDLQIIVLSCRQRAFRELGGTALELKPAPE